MNRIEFDDDMVEVRNKDTNEVIYKGIEDYEPMKDSNWRWDKDNQSYYLKVGKYFYTKKKIG